MNALDGMEFCTVCNTYVPEGVACSDPDCPILNADTEVELTGAEDLRDPEPINFHKLEDLREYDYDAMGLVDPYYDTEDIHSDPDDFEDR